MTYEQLVELQKKLDDRISERFTEVGEDEKLICKVGSLFVELAEVCNAAKIFKYWSSKTPNKGQVVEELADMLHFFLSIAIQEGVELPWDFEPDASTYKIFTHEERALAFYGVLTQMVYASGQGFTEALEGAFIKFLVFVDCLGVDRADLEMAYLTKNEENHRRQEEGY